MALANQFEVLFQKPGIKNLDLRNRIVMAPMTRRLAPDGIPNADTAAYYRRRAEGSVGLIITEGTWIPHPTASNDENVPRFYGEDALAGWKVVVDDVHAAGGRIMPQLWHVGQVYRADQEDTYEADYGDRQFGPSGMAGTMGKMPTLRGRAATTALIEEVIEAYAAAAYSAQQLGFDGVELHGAHGYIFDQFHWSVTNHRNDGYGGNARERTRFACDVVREMRRRTGPNFPIVMRMSQWKIGDYAARLAETPQQLADVLEPMADAGVDIFHCSQRRFWEDEFGSGMNLAGWAKKLTGRPSISVGSVSLQIDFLETLAGGSSEAAGIDRLIEMMQRGDFDLIAVGRALLVDPNWSLKMQRGEIDKITPYDHSALATLY